MEQAPGPEVLLTDMFQPVKREDESEVMLPSGKRSSDADHVSIDGRQAKKTRVDTVIVQQTPSQQDVKQEKGTDIVEEATSGAPKQIQAENVAQTTDTDTRIEGTRAEEIFKEPEPSHGDLNNAKNEKRLNLVRTEGGIKQESRQKHATKPMKKSGAIKALQSRDARNSKQTHDICTRAEFFAALKEIGLKICEKDEFMRDLNDLQTSLRSFGQRELVPCKDGKWLHRMLALNLYNDQVIGVSRMKELEKIGDGGILADQMGFGKTAQAITLIITTPLPADSANTHTGTRATARINASKQGSGDDGHEDEAEAEFDCEDEPDVSRATLIICPPRSGKQLLHECKRWTQGGRKVQVVPYARNHENAGFDDVTYDRCDIIVTTFSEVVASYRVLCDILKELDLTFEDDWHTELTRAGVKLPVPYALKFWRVILDESHSIRNMKTLRSKACHALQRVKSWCISGTPYINSTWDLQSQLIFVGDENAQTRGKFKTTYCRVDDEGDLISLNEKIGPLMIRRTSRDTRFGAPIIPEIKIERLMIRIPQSRGEKAVTRLITEIMDSLREDAKENNKFVPGFALTKLLRLRQNVSNPLILEDFLFRTFTHTSLKDFKLRLAEIEAEIDVLPNVSRELSRADANIQGGDDQDLRAGESNMGDLFDVSIAFKKIICNKCDRLCKERQRLRLECDHIFCKACIFTSPLPEGEIIFSVWCTRCESHRSIVQPHGQNDDKTTQHRPGDNLQDPPHHNNDVDDDDDDDDDSNGSYWANVVDEYANKKTKSRRSKNDQGEEKSPERRPGYDYRGSHPSLGNRMIRWLQESDRAGNVSLIRGGKIGPCADLCEEILKKNPGDKIMAFTQFDQEAAMIGRMLQHKSIPFLYFNGKMTPRQTDERLKDMAQNPEIKVMIVGIKCGGESLNCQFANHAILVGPYWSNAGEEQAIGRVARLGQKKKVYVYKLEGEGSADEHVSSIQERKRDEAADLMGEVPAQYQTLTSDELNAALQ
ncbi:hypothetical protein G7054_g14921 [Neopestalotiopsis clavispora]|nr:hypothetical protein G7054_g14921 [Neopestalotiopsis clavispora]